MQCVEQLLADAGGQDYEQGEQGGLKGKARTFSIVNPIPVIKQVE